MSGNKKFMQDQLRKAEAAGRRGDAKACMQALEYYVTEGGPTAIDDLKATYWRQYGIDIAKWARKHRNR